MGRLDNKVALVTGSARGMGATEARLFAREGAEVVVTDVLDDLGAQTAAEIGAKYLHLDVTSLADWESVAGYVSETSAGWTSWSTMPGSSRPGWAGWTRSPSMSTCGCSTSTCTGCSTGCGQCCRCWSRATVRRW